MGYSFHILQVSRPYIDATLCKVWASNSSWLSGYSLLSFKNVPAPHVSPLRNKKSSCPQLWTNIEHGASILSVTSPYMDAPFCKVWGLKSAWFVMIFFFVDEIVKSDARWRPKAPFFDNWLLFTKVHHNSKLLLTWKHIIKWSPSGSLEFLLVVQADLFAFWPKRGWSWTSNFLEI